LVYTANLTELKEFLTRSNSQSSSTETLSFVREAPSFVSQATIRALCVKQLSR